MATATATVSTDTMALTAAALPLGSSGVNVSGMLSHDALFSGSSGGVVSGGASGGTGTSGGTCGGTSSGGGSGGASVRCTTGGTQATALAAAHPHRAAAAGLTTAAAMAAATAAAAAMPGLLPPSSMPSSGSTPCSADSGHRRGVTWPLLAASPPLAGAGSEMTVADATAGVPEGVALPVGGDTSGSTPSVQLSGAHTQQQQQQQQSRTCCARWRRALGCGPGITLPLTLFRAVTLGVVLSNVAVLRVFGPKAISTTDIPMLDGPLAFICGVATGAGILMAAVYNTVVCKRRATSLHLVVVKCILNLIICTALCYWLINFDAVTAYAYRGAYVPTTAIIIWPSQSIAWLLLHPATYGLLAFMSAPQHATLPLHVTALSFTAEVALIIAMRYMEGSGAGAALTAGVAVYAIVYAATVTLLLRAIRHDRAAALPALPADGAGRAARAGVPLARRVAPLYGVWTLAWLVVHTLKCGGVLGMYLATWLLVSLDGFFLVISLLLIMGSHWQLEATRAHDLALARAANEEKRKILGYLCHEMRVPLNGIVLAAQDLLLAGEPQPWDLVTGHLSTIDAAGRVLGHLLDDFLSLQKIEAGRLTLTPQATEPVRVAEEAVELFASVAATRHNSLRVEAAAGAALPAVWMDPHRTRQVLSNLLSNALKFSPPGAPVVVRVERIGPGGVGAGGTNMGPSSPTAAAAAARWRDTTSASPTIVSMIGNVRAPFAAVAAVAAAATGAGGGVVPATTAAAISGGTVGGHIRYTVVDSGCGISAEDQASLFKPFMQIQAGALQKGNGTGLGLHICKLLVEMQGGTIGCRSAPGEGSEFWVEIPATRPPEGAPSVSDTSPLHASALDAHRVAARAAAVAAATSPTAHHGGPGWERPVTLAVVTDASGGGGGGGGGGGSGSRYRAPEGSPPSLHCLDTSTAGCAAPSLSLRHSTSSGIVRAPDGGDATSGGSSGHPPGTMAWVGIAGPASSAEEGGAGGTSLQLAVVTDDTESNRVMLARIVRRLGFARVLECDSGASALALPPEVTAAVQMWFVDRNMPGMDGQQLVRTLRTRGVTAPILGVTGDALADDCAAFMRAGVTEVLPKPVTAAIRAQAIATYVPGAAAAARRRSHLTSRSGSTGTGTSPPAATPGSVVLGATRTTTPLSGVAASETAASVLLAPPAAPSAVDLPPLAPTPLTARTLLHRNHHGMPARALPPISSIAGSSGAGSVNAAPGARADSPGL